jgi:hypothetical protein
MTLKIRNNANPDLIGDIQPGWSIDENATPHVIGDGSASVGGVQFSAGRRDDSEFLLNKPVTVYYEPEGTVTAVNNVTGVFDSVDASGASAGVTSTNLLAKLTAERSIRPTFNLDKEMLVKTSSTTGGTDAIGVHARLDTTRGMVGFLYAYSDPNTGITSSAVRFLSPSSNEFVASVVLAGSAYYAAYPYEIDSTGRIYLWNPDSKTIQVYSPAGALITSWSSPTTDGTSGFTTIKYNPYDNNLWVIDNISRIRVFSRSGTLVRTFTAYDEFFTPSNGIGVRASSISFTKDYAHVAESRGVYAYTYLGTPAFYTLYDGIAYDNNTGNNATKQIEVDAYGNYVVHVAAQLLYMAQRYGVLYRSAPLPGTPSINADGNYLVVFGDYQAPNVITGYRLYAGSPVTTRGYFFSVLATILGDLSKVTYSGSSSAAVYPGWNDSLWTKLNELSAATGKEIVLQNDALLVRDVRASTVELTNFIGSPQRSGNTGTGRHVEVVNQNTYNLSGSVIFDYRTDATRTVTADVNERNVTNIAADAWLVSVQNPTPGNGSTGAYPDDGGYFIMASDGQWIPGAVWTQYGGSVVASVGANGTSIDLTVNGPVATIGGYPAPYTIGSVVGTGRATGLSLIGSGVGFNPQAVKVATGADWSITSEDISQTINQPFITDLPTAYERGEFAAAAANGASQTLTATIPTADIGGLGLTNGAMFRYDKAWWRIRSSKIGNATISITADLLTTTAQHDAVVPGETIGAHDARLAALTLGDSAIKPLY